MKTEFWYYNFWYLFYSKCQRSNFLHLKTKFHHSYILVLFTKFSAVGTMPPTEKKMHWKWGTRKGLGISVPTGKTVKGNNRSGFASENKESLLQCNHLPDFDNFPILATNKEFELLLMGVFKSSKITFLWIRTTDRLSFELFDK